MREFEFLVESLSSVDLHEVFTDRFPWIYVHWKAESEKVPLEEAARRSLNRILGAMLDLDSQAALITAFRSDKYDLATNRQRNRELEKDLSMIGGYAPVIGGFVQNKDTEQEKAVEEESFVVHSPKGMPGKTFAKIIQKILKDHNQEAALIKFRDDPAIHGLGADGSVFDIGEKWSFDELAEYYTKMRYGGQKNKKFKFECAGTRSVATRGMVYYWLRNKIRQGI